MTTTTIEQFREQCAKTIELFDDATMRESDYMLDAHQCADIIRALPLPVMPSQDAEVMPEQAEPAGYQIRQVNYSGEEWQTPWTGATKQSCIDAGIEVRDLFAQDPSALLARIAELEAEIQKLKEDAAWLPIEQCLIGKPAIVKVNGIVQHIIVMLNNEGDWDCLDDGPYLDDFHPSHFKYLPEDDKA